MKLLIQTAEALRPGQRMMMDDPAFTEFVFAIVTANERVEFGVRKVSFAGKPDQYLEPRVQVAVVVA